MSQDTEVEFDIDSTEPNASSTEIAIEWDDDNTSQQESKNESNFKKLYKSNKEKEKALAEKEALIAEQARELQEWRELNPDYVAEKSSNKSIESMEIKVFGLENPEAKQHLDEVKATAKTYWLPLEKAWKLVKADLPTPSESTSDFDLKSSPNKVKKSMKDVTAEEALKLTSAQQAEWRKIHLGID